MQRASLDHMTCPIHSGVLRTERAYYNRTKAVDTRYPIIMHMLQNIIQVMKFGIVRCISICNYIYKTEGTMSVNTVSV